MDCVQITETHQGRTLVARLSRPKANILDAEMITSLRNGIENHLTQQTCALMITHSGPHFSFGASVEEHQKQHAKNMLNTFHGLFRYLHDISVPILAVVRGQCLGGGMELATFAHFIFASEDAFFGQPEIKLAVFPPMASLILNVRCPEWADQINLTGQSFPATDLQKAGLVTSVSAEPEEEALAFIERHFLNKSASSLRIATRANRWRMEQALSHQLPHLEQLYLETLMGTEDACEGIQSFIEKRKPTWSHQ